MDIGLHGQILVAVYQIRLHLKIRIALDCCFDHRSILILIEQVRNLIEGTVIPQTVR